MTLSGSQAAAQFQSQARTLKGLADSYHALVGELAQTEVVLDEKLAAARRELAAVYLPELTDAAFDRVARLTGFQGFARRDPRAAIVHERKVLEQSLAKLDADPRYASRDVEATRLAGEAASARDTLAPLELECEKFETQPGFLELVQLGYDTPAFAEKWWHANYWKHWAAGDRICKALDMNDFGDDVLPAYKKVAEPRDYMRSEVKRIESQIDAIHELTRERDRMSDRAARLEQIYLAEAQDFLGEHLENADVGLLEQWVAAEPSLQRAVQMGLRKLSGITAKRRFVREMRAVGVPEVIKQLDERRVKAQQKQGKFSRPKYAYVQLPFDGMDVAFNRKAESLAQQRDKLSRRTQALVAAENYGGFDLRNDQELWWLYLMQSPPPRLMPSVYDYYQRRPDVAPMTDPDYVDMGPMQGEVPGDAAARAFIAGDLEQGGAYLS
jgi:hypothetical protein